MGHGYLATGGGGIAAGSAATGSAATGCAATGCAAIGAIAGVGTVPEVEAVPPGACIEVPILSDISLYG